MDILFSKGVIEMKKALFFVGFLILSSLCFAEYYGEYSFAEEDKIDHKYLSGNGWGWSVVYHWTKEDIQKEIEQIDQQNNASGRRVYLANYMRKMLRASNDKRIFIIDYTVKQGPYGWLFIKMN
jgi:hypothetical protein